MDQSLLARPFITKRLVFPESPRWHEGALWFSDLIGGKVFRADEQGQLTLVAQYSDWISGIGWWPDGSLCVVGMNDRQMLERDGDTLVAVADLTSVARMHSNDMLVLPNGCAFFGEVGYDVHGGEAPRGANLVRYTQDRNMTVVAADLGCPNGMALMPDGKTLLVAETFRDRITAFDMDEEGTLSNRRIWAAMDGHQPDGICLDDAGGLWVACPFTNVLRRVLEGGEVTHQITFETLPLACVYGGENRDTLYVCTALHPDEATQSMAGGAIQTVQTGYRGAGYP
jgi:sugar lactone lactonase YvrE